MSCVLVMSMVLTASPFELSKLENGASLPELVWRQSAELQAARVRVAEAQAAHARALRLPNPGLDVGLNTLPVGPINPPELTEPFLNVPNLSVGLWVLLELGKRGPRQDATAEAARAVALDALDQLRRKVLELEEIIGDVAAAQVRVDALIAIGEDAQRLAALQQARADKGDSSALDADRARLELEGTLTALGESREQLLAALRQCADVVASTCVAFSDVGQANSWLDRRFEVKGDEPVGRPDLKALEAAVRAARASHTLASRGWIPDPTVRVGYVRDQFVFSGNQQNSLFVGFSMPLPLFERGQDDAAAAAVAAASAERARQQLLDTARSQLSQLQSEIDSAETRQARIRDQSVPLARSVVDRLTAAVTRGAAPLQELILARRTLAELLLTGTELDRSVFRLHVARARLSSSLDAFPAP